MRVSKKSALRLLLFLMLFTPLSLLAQDEDRKTPAEEETYGSKFFNQLRSLFGRFQESDLQRSFLAADGIRCSELVSHKGEWRPVAFFNEDRSLGEWCRESLEEVKSDPTLFTFKGSCPSDRSSVLVATEFPVSASVEAYNRRELDLSKVQVTANAPVSVVFDDHDQAYTFALPYLFPSGRRGSMQLYSLQAKGVKDAYANDVTSRWECKAVRSTDVTYRFLIGASAFFILSDGVETHTSVSLSFGDAPTLPGAPPAAAGSPSAPVSAKPEVPAASEGWQVPEPGSQFSDAARKSFRLRFNSRAWAGKVNSPQVLIDQKLAALSEKASPTGDYCAWYPGLSELSGRLLAKEPDPSIRYAIGGFNRSRQSSVSFIIDLKSDSGFLLGKLQCHFARDVFADDITFERWLSIVGSNVALEIKQ